MNLEDKDINNNEEISNMTVLDQKNYFQRIKKGGLIYLKLEDENDRLDDYKKPFIYLDPGYNPFDLDKKTCILFDF